MRIDGNAAPVVAHAEPIAGLERDVDGGRVPCDRLVHRVVQHFGRQMVQGGLVGAADIHARAPANRLEPFQDLDVPGGIASLASTAAEGGQEIVHAVFLALFWTVATSIRAGKRFGGIE